MAKQNIDSKKLKKKKIFDIVSWVLVSVIFLASLTLLITRKSSGSLSIFGHRYDVVLSNSMSYKNPEHSDFLKGHNDQIQKMDVVRSKEINKNTVLNVYDIVLFQDPKIGTNMHRIVDKKVYTQDEVYLQEASIDSNNNIVLGVHNSAVYTNNNFSFTYAEFTFVSDKETFSDSYYFSTGSTILDKTVTTSKHGSSFYHKVVIDKTSDRPAKFTIVHSGLFDYSSEVISKIYFKTANGKINTNGKSFSLVEGKTDEFQFITNTSYEYEIRGDAAKTSDGWFTIEGIYSKVDRIIPKAGYVTRFLTSIPGIILLICLGLLILFFDYGFEWLNKAERDNNTLIIYYSSEDDSCTYSLKGQKESGESLNAESIGKDRYNANIYRITIDISKYQSIRFANHEEDVSLENVNSGTGFYYEGQEVHSYTHSIETKGKKNANKKK